MKAIILSAGKGERIKTINPELPKVLFPILDKPMLIWNIELLKKHGITEIVINTHYLGEKIKDYLGDGSKFGVSIKYSYESELLGTSGALNNFRDFFNETFVVIYGDVISKIDLTKLIHFHKQRQAAATLVVHKTDHPEDSDIVQLDDKGKITNLIHKPGNTEFGDIGNAALYVLEPFVLDYIPYGESDFIKDVFPKMILNKEKIYGYNTNEFIKDAGTTNRIKQIEEHLNNPLDKIEFNYYQELKNTIDAIDKTQLDKIEEVLKQAKIRKSKIFLIGNGGSASTCEHICNDFIKIASLRATALTNVSVLTAYGNDISYDSVFSEQLKNLLDKEDIVIAITGSGNSPNIINALEYANNKGSVTIAFLGFEGGLAKNIAKNIAHIKSDNYGIIEDLHLSLGHYFALKLKEIN